MSQVRCEYCHAHVIRGERCENCGAPSQASVKDWRRNPLSRDVPAELVEQALMKLEHAYGALNRALPQLRRRRDADETEYILHWLGLMQKNLRMLFKHLEAEDVRER